MCLHGQGTKCSWKLFLMDGDNILGPTSKTGRSIYSADRKEQKREVAASLLRLDLNAGITHLPSKLIAAFLAFATYRLLFFAWVSQISKVFTGAGLTRYSFKGQSDRPAKQG